MTETVWLTKPNLLSGPVHKRFASACCCCTRAPGQEGQQVLKYHPPLSSWGVPPRTGHTQLAEQSCVLVGGRSHPLGGASFPFTKLRFMSWSPPGQGGTISYFAQRSVCADRLAVVRNIFESYCEDGVDFQYQNIFTLERKNLHSSYSSISTKYRKNIYGTHHMLIFYILPN